MVFNSSLGYQDLPVTIPCGQCIGCRLDKSRSWAARILHEAQTTGRACFITLTISPQQAAKRPVRGLDKHELRRFLRRLRRAIGKTRYYACGEYGELLGRPHYHAIIFGHNFAADRKHYKLTEQGNVLYTSATLTKAWGLGHTVLSDVTFETAAYVARYAVKKITGELAAAWYKDLEPEFATMSLRPGIGHDWITKYSDEALQRGTVICRGKEVKNPRYYDDKLKIQDPQRMKEIARERTRQASAHKEDKTLKRLQTREEVTLAQFNTRKRHLH